MKKGKKPKRIQVELSHWIILRLMLGHSFPKSKQINTDRMMAYLYLTRYYDYEDIGILMSKLKPEYQSKENEDD